MKTLVVLAISVVLTACGSTPPVIVKVGNEVENINHSISVALPSKGQLFILQRLNPEIKCENVKTRLIARVTSETSNEKILLDRECDVVANGLTINSRSSLNKGNYLVSITRDESPAFTANPIVLARYEDPEFNAGPDYLIDGAKELAAGQAMKANVSYAQGNPTIWVRLKGKNTKIGLTLLQNPEARDIHVQLYDQSAPGKAPKIMGTLIPKKKRELKIKEDNILVKITAHSIQGQGELSLVRSELEGGGGKATTPIQNISVVDCYRVSENTSVVLLQSTPNLKVNDTIAVFGQRLSGETIALGECQISSIVGPQASCHLPAPIPPGLIQFRAETTPAPVS